MYTEIFKPSEPGCSMKTAIRNYFNNYVTFSGRSSRSEYWKYVLFNFLVTTPFYVLMIALSANIYKHSYDYYYGYYYYEDTSTATVVGIIAIALGLWGLINFLPSLAILFRRLHDSGKSGWCFLLAFVPIVGWLILFIFTLLETEPLVNQYGGVKDRNYPHKYAQAAQGYSSTNNTSYSSQSGVASDLEKYGQMLKDGLLTQEEFDKIKKRALNL